MSPPLPGRKKGAWLIAGWLFRAENEVSKQCYAPGFVMDGKVAHEFAKDLLAKGRTNKYIADQVCCGVFSCTFILATNR